jgi:hypothetical protein
VEARGKLFCGFPRTVGAFFSVHGSGFHRLVTVTGYAELHRQPGAAGFRQLPRGIVRIHRLSPRVVRALLRLQPARPSRLGHPCRRPQPKTPCSAGPLHVVMEQQASLRIAATTSSDEGRA